MSAVSKIVFSISLYITGVALFLYFALRLHVVGVTSDNNNKKVSVPESVVVAPSNRAAVGIPFRYLLHLR